MRVLHTSDWHIGRRFKGIDLLEYQRKALEWLIGLIKREQVDVLCVSGDVYDAPRPSAGAVRLFNEMFQRLGLMEVNGHPLHIIFTPGNHDSAARLGFAAALMLPNVHMRCDIADIATPIMVDSADGEQLAIYALPYLDPDLARPALQGLLNSADVLSSSAKVSDSAESDKRRETNTIRRSHEGVIRAALQLITADLAARRKANPKLNAMLMAHAFVSGATASDSERNITVGGVDSVPAELFSNSGLDYLALGHLHRPQKITIPTKPTTESQTPPVEGNGKSVVLLDFTDGHLAKPRIMPVESGEPPFVQIKGTMDDVLGPLAEQYRNMWVSITVQVPELPHGAYQKIDRAYTHALEKNFDYSQRTQSQESRKMADLKQATDEMDVLRDFVKFSLGRTPTDKEERVLRDAMETVRKNAGKEVAQ